MNTILNKERMLKNINGLSLGDTACCGPYGRITCIKEAIGFAPRWPRKFKVAKSSILHNGGNWTMTRLRKAIRES